MSRSLFPFLTIDVFIYTVNFKQSLIFIQGLSSIFKDENLKEKVMLNYT